MDIEKGVVNASVQGSRRRPYKVEIDIAPISGKRKEDLIARCSARIDSMD